MKRLLALVLLLALVGATSATSLNFQNPTDLASIGFYGASAPGAYYTWVESATGGNNYVSVGETDYAGGDVSHAPCIRNSAAYMSTYAAATALSASSDATSVGPGVILFDSSNNVLDSYKIDGSLGYPMRIETKLVGGKAYVYVNGVLKAVSGSLSINPSYIGFCMFPNNYGALSVNFDDFVYGQTENKVVLGLPESDEEVYVVLDDILNDASDGLYNVTNGQVQSTYMTGTWSRGNDTTPLENQTIQLVNYYTSAVYATNYTGTGYHETVQIDIKTLLIDAGAPDGLYALYIPGSGKYSNLIWKKSNGASVHWSSKSYSTGDTGSVITVVADGGYWDTSSYSYSLAVQDVYGVTHGANTSITTQTQTVTHVWDADTYDAGVYYAVLYATSLSTGKQYVLGFDYTTLTTKYQIEGYVNADMTARPISGAFLNWSQGTSMTNTTSNASGYYHTDPIFITGSVIGGNVSASGYDTYWWNGTVMLAGSKFINITLTTNPHTFTGIGLGGVDTESLYHRPLSASYIRVYNTTYSEEWNMQTNNAGFYWIDEAATPEGYDYLGPGGGASAGRDGNGASATLNPHVQAVLTAGRLYCAEAYKVGYSNTTECRVVTGA